MLGTFNSETARRLIGLSKRQIDYWDRTHIVKPSIREASGRGSVRLYSFTDLVQLRVVKALREAGLSLQKIRKSLNYLRNNMLDIETPLAQFRFITDGATVFVLAPNEDVLVDTLRHGQMALTVVPLDRMVADLKGSVRDLSQRRRYTVEVQRKKFEVFLEPDVGDGGFVVECPDLPGCVCRGRTVEEALSMIADAIEGRLEVELTKDGQEKAEGSCA